DRRASIACFRTRCGKRSASSRCCAGALLTDGDNAMIRAIACPYFRRAFGWCVPIGGLGGLIGLGGGEFRLPVLMHGIGFDARSAVPLNLLTSLVTLTFEVK